MPDVGEGFRGRSLVVSRWLLVAGRFVARGSRGIVGKGWYASSLGGGTGAPPVLHPISAMPYRVVSFTMAQVRRGALGFQRELSAVLREHSGIKVYSVSPFDLDERRRMKDRFGGDIVYFLNDAACQECERLGLNLQFVGEISDDELPRRRSLVVGVPERTGNVSAKWERR